VNVGILIGRFPPEFIGGAELQVQQLAAELAQRGHTVVVFTRRYSGRPRQEWQDGYMICRRDELPMPRLRMAWDTFPALADIARQRPQVLLCYQTLNSGLIGVVAQSLLGIPAVVSIRGNREYRLQGSISSRLLVPAIYRRARCLVVQSPRILDDLHEQLGLAGQAGLSRQLQNKIKVIPNGVRPSCGVEPVGSQVLYVGRLIRDKGVADLLLALKQIPEAEALIVGDGPDRERLESLAQGMRVTFTGRVMPSAIPDYMKQARILVLPSHRGDGLPNVILEAMACGVPVVATRTAGIPDLVQHEQTGFLFEPGDIHQMSSYIGCLLQDEQAWKDMSQRSLQQVLSYSWSAVVPQIEELLMSYASPSQRPKEHGAIHSLSR
jgi:glycosyltransferase involved in cell wall biosynthesis